MATPFFIGYGGTTWWCSKFPSSVTRQFRKVKASNSNDGAGVRRPTPAPVCREWTFNFSFDNLSNAEALALDSVFQVTGCIQSIQVKENDVPIQSTLTAFRGYINFASPPVITNVAYNLNTASISIVVS